MPDQSSAAPTLHDESLDESPSGEMSEKVTNSGPGDGDGDGSRVKEPIDLKAPHVDAEASDNVLIVDWDGPDDPQNPKNWSFKRKWAATAIVSAFTFISPISSSMVAPAASVIAVEFGITNTVVIALTISVFVLAYAFGPLFLGPLSEIYGRSRVLQLANMWYFAWNLGCGFAQNKGQLIAFRFLAGLGGSAPLSIGGGVLGDCWLPEERGKAVALFSLAPLLGPVIGPVAGAWIADRVTWRWVFWATTIVDGIIQMLGLLFLQETFAPLLLERKAKRIRQELESDCEKSGSTPRIVKTRFQMNNSDHQWQQILAKALIRPFKLFFLEPIIQLFGAYMAFVYGVMYLFLTTMPGIFEGVYRESIGIAGLHYIALGLGLTIAAQINARLMDKIYAVAVLEIWRKDSEG
ncbi:hypothetical protein EIP86_002151 [Pleurotus ostreatoroseus]|nr:hypothetical protein EIP86_002151 [Pleurotus ostreatoroseus]